MNTVNRDVTYVSVRYDPLSLTCDYPDLEVESLDPLASTEAFELGLESKLHQAFPDAEVDIIPATVSVTEIIVQHDEPWDDMSPEWTMAMADHVAAIVRAHFENGGWLVAGEGY